MKRKRDDGEVEIDEISEAVQYLYERIETLEEKLDSKRLREDDIIAFNVTLGQDKKDVIHRTMSYLKEGHASIVAELETQIRKMMPFTVDYQKYLYYTLEYKLAEKGRARSDLNSTFTKKFMKRIEYVEGEEEEEYEEEERARKRGLLRWF